MLQPNGPLCACVMCACLQVGYAPTSARFVRQTLGGAVPEQLAALAPGMTTAPGLSIDVLCNSLKQAADAVLAAANSLSDFGSNQAGGANNGPVPARMMACV